MEAVGFPQGLVKSCTLYRPAQLFSSVLAFRKKKRVAQGSGGGGRNEKNEGG
jgi:hypothetical protein